jgi:hypothetical protein
MRAALARGQKEEGTEQNRSRTGDRSSTRQVRAFTSLRRRDVPFRPEVALPAPLRRRRCGSTGADRLQLLGLARETLAWLSGSASPRRDRSAAPGDIATRVLALPAISLRLRARLL